MKDSMDNRKFAPAALGRVILALLFVAALSSCGTTAVTDEVLTPYVYGHGVHASAVSRDDGASRL